MKQLNTLPIETFLDKARVAIRSNQKNLSLTIAEVQSLHDSLAVVMTRMSGQLDQILTAPREVESTLSIKMDGGAL